MNRKKIIGLLCGLVFISICIAGTYTGVKAEETDTIKTGVRIGSIDVGGMTKAEATDAVNEYVEGIMDTTFTLTGVEGEFTATAKDMGLTSDVAGAVEEAMGIAKNGNLIHRFKEEKELESGEYKVDMGLSVDQQRTGELIYEHKEQLDIPAEDNRVVRENGAFTFVEGTKGKEVNVVDSVYAIEDYLNNEWEEGDSEIALVVDEVEPRGSEEELSKIQDVLGESSTNFGSSSHERATNVKNGCSKINGTILYPGDEFSVYETVSPFTQENGYELAGSYANGTTVESFGGGICQVSTTLYLAAIRAELEIVQRYNHSMAVAYVKPSMDAAIAGTYKDFRFRNNYDAPIYIQGYCDGGVLYFNIYGEETRPANREVFFESETLETVEPEVKINLSSSQSLGYINVDQSAHTGYKAQLWKIVKVDGVEESREIFNKSTYQASPKIITVGTKGATEEQLAKLKSAASSKNESKVRELVAAAKAQNETEKEDEEKDETEETEGSDSTVKDQTDNKADSQQPDDVSKDESESAGDHSADNGPSEPDAGTVSSEAEGQQN